MPARVAGGHRPRHRADGTCRAPRRRSRSRASAWRALSGRPPSPRRPAARSRRGDDAAPLREAGRPARRPAPAPRGAPTHRLPLRRVAQGAPPGDPGARPRWGARARHPADQPAGAPCARTSRSCLRSSSCTTVTVPALRGSIYDRNGELLALSVPTKQVVADDFQITHPTTRGARRSRRFSASRRPHSSPSSQEHNGYVVLSKYVGVATATTSTNDALPRHHAARLLGSRPTPTARSAESVLGGPYADGDGAAGLEYQYQQLLAGQSGSSALFESPTGVSLPSAQPVILHATRSRARGSSSPSTHRCSTSPSRRSAPSSSTAQPSLAPPSSWTREPARSSPWRAW